MKIIAIEEHWNSVGIRDALDRLADGARDESVAFNTMGDNQIRLEDIGQRRIEAMDAAGIDVSILSVVTPATQALPAREAVALARDANDEATDAVRAHPARFRAFATLPTSDPQAAAAELERCATRLGHAGAMAHGRSGSRPLDDPAYDDLFATAARLHQPIFIHPQIPSNELRDAAYRGLDPLVDLGLPTFGWGWHMDTGLSALPAAVRQTAAEMITAGVRPPEAWISAKHRPAMARVTSAAPRRSRRPARVGSRDSGSFMNAATMTNAPSGRLIRKTARHDSASVR